MVTRLVARVLNQSPKSVRIFVSSMIRTNETQTEGIDGVEIGPESTTASVLADIRAVVKKAGHPELLKREFVTVGDGGDTGSKGKFRLMQFNILAQGLSLGSDNFTKCPDAALVWNMRKVRLMEEILTVDPDVLCMQEVDHFGMFKTLLSPLGYEGCFIPKPDSPALLAPDTNGPDGCALFYRADKFHPVKQETIGLMNGEITTNQVAVIKTLMLKASGINITMATTHLKAKYGFETLRHSQGRYLLDYVTKNYGENPLIFCGDFNADPTEPVYEEFARSKLALKSAYAGTGTSGGDDDVDDAAYTTWKIRDREIRRTIDYIWYQPSSMRVTAVRSIPSAEEIGENRLPSFRYPSDHLSLAADFNMMPQYSPLEQVETISDLEIKDGATVQEALAAVKSLVKSRDFPPLVNRRFVPVEQPAHEDKKSFRLMQFNILAHGLTGGVVKFLKCPPEALEWPTRRIRIIEEILSVDPDVLCMQEVDHFGFFRTLLAPLGYEGIFCPKPRSPALRAPDTNGPDGCAIFYRTAAFQLADSELIIGLEDRENATNQVAVVCALKQRSDGKRVTIATTHLKAGLKSTRDWPLIRMDQGKFLMDYLREHYKDHPLIICGDFNAVPDEEVYKHYTSSTLKSAYTTGNSDGREPPYTYWSVTEIHGKQSEVYRTLDYIWYEEDKMAVTGLLSIPTGEELGEGRLPSHVYPSDHVAIAADLHCI